MEMMNYSMIPTRLAAALLLKRGEISLGEIRALPLVDDKDFALAIADVLAQNFEVERYERYVGQSASQFDDVIRLVTPLYFGHKRHPATQPEVHQASTRDR